MPTLTLVDPNFYIPKPQRNCCKKKNKKKQKPSKSSRRRPNKVIEDVSVAAAKEISDDAAGAAGLSELHGIFTLKEKQITEVFSQ